MTLAKAVIRKLNATKTRLWSVLIKTKPEIPVINVLKNPMTLNVKKKDMSKPALTDK
ncbi:MAG: hypothetical protein J6I65_06200 [Lachnospiraceae bacterium]|nr:hypothetical protein [Lachnospiraceae bacterium]